MKIKTRTARILKIQHRNTVEQLYDRYGGTLYGIILKMVCSKDVAQKVMEDTFLKVCRQNPQDDSKGRLFPWILNIARSTAIDALAEQTIAEPLATETDIQSQLKSKIDDKSKELIDLTYFKGCTQKETSEKMNIPINLIKTRLRVAISELRKSLEEPDNSTQVVYPILNRPIN